MRRAAIVESHAQASTTATTKLRTITGLLDPEAIPKKAAKKTTPVATEYAAQPH